MHPGALPAGRLTYQGNARPQRSSLNAAAAGVTTRPTTGAAASGKRQKRRLQSKCPTNAPGPAVLLSSPPQTEWSRHSHPQSRRALDLVGTKVVRGGRVVNATLSTPPETAPRSVTGVPQKDKMTELNMRSNAANPVLKATKALGQVQVTSTKVKSGKSSPKNTNPTKPIPPPQSVKSPLEEISDLLDTLPLAACVEQTRRLRTAAPTLPSGAARSRAVLKNRCPVCSRIWQHGLEGRKW
jgi:hypothetical protein